MTREDLVDRLADPSGLGLRLTTNENGGSHCGRLDVMSVSRIGGILHLRVSQLGNNNKTSLFR